MAIFCIPKHLVDKLRESALKGGVDIKKIYEMSSAQRRDYFSKFTNPELGKFLNVEFEKAVASKRGDALMDWAKSTFDPQTKKSQVYQTVIDKIKAFQKDGVFSPASENAFLEDLVADRLGISVTPEEVGKIMELSSAIDSAEAKLGDNLGDPLHVEDNVAFFKAKKAMDDYLLSRAPASRLRIATGTIGRGIMLFSVKSPLLNIESNLTLLTTEALARRVSELTYKGTDWKIGAEYIKMVNKIYKETGYDISRMQSLSDTGASGARILGDVVHAQGEGATRKVGRFFEDVVFKKLLGSPDTFFSSIHFADSVNLNALKVAKGDRVVARELMSDAMRIQPKTVKGELLREQAILDAQVATWTNESWASKATLGIRKIFNDLSGDLRVGDQLMPFVKTPANVIATGLDYAGMGIPKALVDTINAIRRGDLTDRQYISKTSRNLVRAGIGITAAFLITKQLDDDDFVGAYDPARSQYEQLRNSNTNSIRIGNHWVSLDYFGPLAIPITAIMYARKYSTNPAEAAFQFAKGAISSTQNLPGIQEVSDAIDSVSGNQNQNLQDLANSSLDTITGYLTSRLIPSVISDIAKAMDPKQRQTGKGLQSVMSKLPFLRQSLPEKKDVLSRTATKENPISTILFGSRIRTSQEDAVTSELGRVMDQTGKSINFTDWDRSNSATLRQFHEKFSGDQWESAKQRYGYWLSTYLQDAIDNPKYKSLSDEDKLTILNGLDAKAMNKVFSQFNFKYQKQQTKKLPSL